MFGSLQIWQPWSLCLCSALVPWVYANTIRPPAAGEDEPVGGGRLDRGHQRGNRHPRVEDLQRAAGSNEKWETGSNTVIIRLLFY